MSAFAVDDVNTSMSFFERDSEASFNLFVCLSSGEQVNIQYDGGRPPPSHPPTNMLTVLDEE